MDRELVAFVGAGLQIVAGGILTAPPKGSLRDGFVFVEHLLKFGDSGLTDVLLGTIRDIWKDWRRAKLPRVVAREHITALPGILETYRVEHGMVLSAVAAIGVSESAGSVAAHRLASVIVEKAAAGGCFDDTGLSRQLTFFFIERLLLRLLVERKLIQDLKVPVAQYFAAYGRRSPIPEAQAWLADPLGFSTDDVLGGWTPGSDDAAGRLI